MRQTVSSLPRLRPLSSSHMGRSTGEDHHTHTHTHTQTHIHTHTHTSKTRHSALLLPPHETHMMASRVEPR